MRNVQISQELFMQLLRFHLMEDESCEKEIKKELEKKLERESRNVNDFFYEMEGRQLQKMNKVLAGVKLTKAEERTLIWLAGWEESTVDHLLSVIEKVARIRADKKGGYAHK